MKKRIISLLLSLVVGMAALFGTALAAEGNKVITPQKELDELVNIGVINTAQAKTAWDTQISRSEMAKLLTGLLGIQTEAGKYPQKFTDVTEETNGYHQIMAMVNLGFMSGYENGTFQPEKSITGIEAGKILIHVLGYKYKAVIGGGFPSGYLACANEIGLSKGIVLSYTEPFLWGELVKLFYNALDIPMAELTSVGQNETYQINPNVTVLTKYLKMQKIKGVVTANDLAGIQGENPAPEGKISIDGSIFTPQSSKDRKLLGLKVSCIYRLNDDQEHHGIVSITELDTKRISFDREQYSSLNGNTLSFFKKDMSSEQRVTFDITADIIYNGERAVYSEDILEKVKVGDFELISTTNSSYNLIIIRDYQVLTVGQINKTEKVISDERDSSKKLHLDNTDKTVSIYDASGNPVSFSFISGGDVLTYMDNANCAEVYVSGSVISGEVSNAAKEYIEEIDENGQTKKVPLTVEVTINDVLYKVNPYMKKALGGLNPGDSVKAVLDHMGYVADATVLNKDGLELLYLIQLDDSDSSLEAKIKGKFFSAGKGISIYSFKERLRVNGVSYKNINLTTLKQELGSPLEQMVSVKFDENKQIIQIDKAKDLITLERDYTDGFCRTHKSIDRELFKDPWTLNRSIYLNSSTQILMIPLDLENAADKDFKVGTVDYLSNGQKYESEAYNRTKNYEIPEVIIVRTKSGSGSAPQFKLETETVVVKSIVQAINGEGEPVKRVKVQQGSKENFFDIEAGSKVEYKPSLGTAFSVDNLGIGDLIRYSKDSYGYIRLLEVYFDHSENKWYGPAIVDKNGIFQTVISRKTGDFVFVPHWFSAKDEFGENIDEYYGVLNLQESTLKLGGISVIERRDGREPYIRAGSSADIEKGLDAVVQIAYGQLIGIIIYK